MQFTQAQVDAIEAAIGVAYDCTPADDPERGEMESNAWKALEIMKANVEPERLVLSGGMMEIKIPSRTLESDLREDR